MIQHLLSSVLAFQTATGILLHLESTNKQKRVLSLAPTRREETCAPLTNVEGTHYTVALNVGKLAQRFNLIVDTGSPWVIIEDCECKEHGSCEGFNCFRANDSSTLIKKIKRNITKTPRDISMFGTGPIEVVVAADLVHLMGNPLQSNMSDGLFLMGDLLLDSRGAFEGIFGLGFPEEKNEIDPSKSKHFEDSFLAKAGITRFSLCFSDSNWTGDGGILLLDTPSATNKLGITHNTSHWQLRLAGVGIETSAERLDFCSSTSASNCAAILDTGTTYILGPENGINKIFSNLCERWPRCNSNYTMVYFNTRPIKKTLAEQNKHVIDEKAKIFQLLLNDCNNWLNHPFDKAAGLNEIPGLNFYVASRDGEETTLTLDPWSFIVMQQEQETRITYQTIAGIHVPTGYTYTGRVIWSCMPTFGAVDLMSTANGPLWTLGLPLFYSYTVGYDMESDPPSISFTKSLCGSCNRSSANRMELGKQDRHTPRKVGTPRLPAKARVMRL